MKDTYKYVQQFNGCKVAFEEMKDDGKQEYRSKCQIKTSGYMSNDPVEYGQICTDVLTYFKKIENNSVHVYPLSASCYYVYYWLYFDKLKKKGKNDNEVFGIYEELVKSYATGVSNDFLCTHYLKPLTESTLKELKDLYSLYENFIKFKSNNCPGVNDKCSCARECVKIYSEYLDKCHQGINKDLCNELEDFRYQYNEQMEKDSECPKVDKVLPSTKRYNIVMLASIIFLITVVTSVTVFILHKFTSFGSWICPSKKRKKQIRNNADEQTCQYLHTSEIMNKNSGRSIHIAYNSA
ncbi:PIR protein [Plasmodium vivax]|uniref:VIR protein n=1 Tax=Plasmodium vivax TaxID=5855 RepID=A0A564ZNX1_PLAVI|nr:PIR protein [Plasmodium vivax]